ncbi:MAG TPA: PilX N-terminal domain-containing pilus assembly protein [candidate division Zixibacteria bacterium]|nr:PilX N-terminal domain-containing pilus assembly protein [candidate division Zixibacteria bacterium]
MKRFSLQSESGFATLIALIMVGMLTLIGLAALSTSDDEVTIAGNELQETRAFYAAEAGLEEAAADLHTSIDSTGTVPSYLPSGGDTANGCTFAFTTVDDGAAQQRVLTTGTLAGLHALVKSYTITSLGTSPIDESKVQLTQAFETALVPLYQFAVFYGNDLEIAPGPDMNLIGRVHSNGNMWLQAGSSLKMDSYVTASGHILHGRKGAGSVDNGDVLIKNGSGNYVSMKQGSDWLEGTDADWYDSSVSRWNGRVQDSAHGQGKLELPLNGSTGDPHAIIEPEASNPDSYESKATLKFIDNQAYQMVAGIWTNVTADMVSKGIISRTDNKFFDQREGQSVDATELDIGKLYDEGYGPSNGVIYFSDETSDYPALRIRDAQTIDAPLTIASQNPVYTYGDFNSTDKKPAAIMADAVTFLSGNFNDGLSTSNKSLRQAWPTTVNASIMTGNTETTASNYNGGFENLPRFLESWSGKSFTWSGSMVCLWYSQQADGLWNGSYYDPPIRNWSYDTDLDDPSKLPPETPVVRVFQRTGWRQEYVGYAQN